MFLFNLTYRKDLSEVDSQLAAHTAFLDEGFAAGRFLCSGRKDPRTGGIILCICNDRKEAERIAAQDPFFSEGIASYEITEFIPSKFTPAFKACLEDGVA